MDFDDFLDLVTVMSDRVSLVYTFTRTGRCTLSTAVGTNLFKVVMGLPIIWYD